MKKLKLLLSTLIVLAISIIFGSEIYATNTMKLNITDERPYTSKIYTVTTPNGNTHTIFKIIKKGETSYTYEDALYCLRSGLGFGNTEYVGNLSQVVDVPYTESYNLKTNATDVINYYRNTIGYNISNTEYNSMLWIIDNMYLPEHEDATEMKEKLLKKAEIVESELTDDDIEFIQQMALWYFTNYDENGGQNSLSLLDTYVLSNTTKIDGQGLSEVKANQIDKLYRYFIENAVLHVEEYGASSSRDMQYVKPQVKVNSSSKTVTTDNGYTVIGPFAINKTAGNIDYDLEINVKDKNGKIIPESVEGLPIIYVVRNATDMRTNIASVEEAIGQGEFYLKISNDYSAEYDLSDVNIETICTYDKIYKTTATLWLGTNQDQPVIKVEKTEPIEGEFNVTLDKVDEDGNLLFGATFKMITEDRKEITVTNNGDGTFNSPFIQITEEGQEFVYEIEEISAPNGYIKINGAIRIKVTTKLNDEGTKYELDTVRFINATGEPIIIDGVTFEIIDNTISITVVNERIKEFDLSLRKFITKVNGKEITTRIPEINTSKLNTITNNIKTTTATYTHSKEPIVVKKGDIVTYTIRIYNEGDLDGYATKIADYIPEGLGYLVDYKGNTDNLWHIAEGTTMPLVGTDGIYESEDVITNLKAEDFYSKETLSEVQVLTGSGKIYSDALEDEVIKAYNSEIKTENVETSDNWQQSTNGTDGVYYRDVEITCIVLSDNTFRGTLRNIAEVQEDKIIDENGEKVDVEDRDSIPANIDKDNYNPPVDNSEYQQDDDDYELLGLRYFDLALRKFITAVNDEAVTTRIPTPTINSEGNLEYVHDKTPVYVANSDLVTYTIRVYNEGNVKGYAIEIADDIPDGLIFLPEHELNKQYGWKMYDSNGKITEDFTKAVEIRTEYLANTLLSSYDATKAISNVNPNCADVKVIFQVIEDNITQEDRIIINQAQITEDKAVDEEGNEIDIDDEDSIPNEWNEGEDDQDIEKIYVKKFDLALLKWVTQTIVTVDGKTTVTDTGFTPYDNPEPIAKVVIDKNKINKTTVKFVYNIIIMNQGEIAGYATEITDYIPEGLEFVAEDNPIWTKESDNKITTRALEETLLQPGESATIEVVFTWKRDADNLGLKTNIAEISEDYNDKGSEDIDSDPDNVKTEDYDKQQEDDDDKALVMLELKTGGTTSYIWLGLTVLLIIAGGIILIQKFVM